MPGAISGGLGFASFTPQGFLISLAINVIVGAITKKLTKPKNDSANFGSEPADRRHIIRSPVTPHRVVYGRASMSGYLAFAATSGSKGEYLHMVVAFAGHECEAFVEHNMNEDITGTRDGSGNVISGKFAGYLQITEHLGAAGQVADRGLVSAIAAWTSAHVGNGICYTHYKLLWDEENGPDIWASGIPTPRAVIDGKNDLLDPRDLSTGFSDNPLRCTLDYLRWAGGFNASDTEWHAATAIASANECDETVSTPPGGTQKRYTCNGTFTRDQTRGNIIADLLSSFGGVAVPHAGVYRIYAAAATVATRAAIDYRDIKGNMRIRPKASRLGGGLFNRIRGTYIDPDLHWQEQDFPQLVSATYLAADGGAPLFRDVQFKFTTDPYMAQRLALIELKRHRSARTIEVPLKFTAYDVAVWDVVPFTIPLFAWTDQDYRCVDLELSPTQGVIGVFQLEDASAYDDDIAGISAVPTKPSVNFVDVRKISAPTGLTLASGDAQLQMQGDGSQISAILVTWSATDATAFVRKYQVQYKKSADTDWNESKEVNWSVRRETIAPVTDGVSYDVRVRAQTALGTFSAWATELNHVVLGKLEPLPDVASMTIDGNVATWPAVVASDLAGYELRYNTGTKVDFGLGILLREADLAREFTLPDSFSAGTNTIMVAAKDGSGNYSATPAYVIVNLGDALVANVVETQDEHADGFTGTKTDCTVSSGDLDADSEATPLMWNANDTALMWSADDNALMWIAVGYKAMVYQWEVSVAAPLAGSTMTLSHTIVGDNQTIEYGRSGGELMWDADDTTAVWDADDTTAVWTAPALAPWPGSIAAAAGSYDFKITIAAGATGGEITALSAIVDAPDRNQKFDDIAISASSTRLTLTGATWTSIQNVQLTVQDDGGAAVSAKAIDKSATLGPLIQCLNASGTPVAGTLDVKIQGY